MCGDGRPSASLKIAKLLNDSLPALATPAGGGGFSSSKALVVSNQFT